MLIFIIVNLRGAGAFSRDFIINLSPQCRALSKALKTEKLKAPLFPGPVGAGTTNDWCIKDPLLILFSHLKATTQLMKPDQRKGGDSFKTESAIACSPGKIFKI